MKVLKLIFKNLLRHKLRTALTILGIAVAVMAFGLLRTVVTAWYSGVEASAVNRLVTRHAVSFILPLPIADEEQIAKVPGVTNISHFTWFQGIYIDERQFFPRMAVDPEKVFQIYPEFLIAPDQLETFKKERNSCVVGEKTAKLYNLKIGDIMSIRGDIYPGQWEFVVRGIYKPKDKTTDATQMFFHFAYLDERMRQEAPSRAGQVGWFVMTIDNPNRAPEISAAVDALFANSRAETKTETEKAFQQSFVSLSGTIITSLQLISYVIIGIILLVLANTIVMTARERIREYAVLKVLGFTSYHIGGLVFGESLLIAILGGVIGVVLTFPVCAGFAEAMSTFFPLFNVEPMTIVLAMIFSLAVGVIAAIYPAVKSVRTRIVDGLRQIG
ncbi:MAG TPA: FtsX-like permease family protein [Bacteroidota bacterium]|nr:FtsX-like permease family protein [Bacteroidota bacterium]